MRSIGRREKSTELLPRMAPLQRLMRETNQDFKSNLRLWSSVVTALQGLSEAYIISLLEDANLWAIHTRHLYGGGSTQCKGLDQSSLNKRRADPRLPPQI